MDSRTVLTATLACSFVASSLKFVDGFPDEATVEKVCDHLDF
jgi:hypothetical protein